MCQVKANDHLLVKIIISANIKWGTVVYAILSPDTLAGVDLRLN